MSKPVRIVMGGFGPPQTSHSRGIKAIGDRLQRDLAVAEEETARRAIESEGCEIIELAPAERDTFARAVAPMHDEARKSISHRDHRGKTNNEM